MATDEKAYHEYKKSELFELASKRGLSPRDNLRKHELVNLLEEGDTKGDANVAEVAQEDEEFGSVRFVGQPGQVCDDLLPYQKETAALEPGEEYSAPKSVLEKLVINSNFEPADDVAEEVYYDMRQKSILGERRAKRLLAGPATTGESARAFDRRMGITPLSHDQAKALHGSAAEPEMPEFDPADDLEIVEGRVVEPSDAEEEDESPENPSVGSDEIHNVNVGQGRIDSSSNTSTPKEGEGE